MGSLENPLVYCDTVKNLIEQIRRIHDELVDHENTIPKCETCRLNYTEFDAIKSQLYPFVQNDAAPKFGEEFNNLENIQTEENTDEELLSLEIVKEETRIESKDETFQQTINTVPDATPEKKPKRSRIMCHICNKSFYKKKCLAAHLEQHLIDPKERLSCQYCEKIFVHKKPLKAHLAQHTGLKLFKCQYCNKAFKTWEYYMSHWKNHRKESDVENQEIQPRNNISTEESSADPAKVRQLRTYSTKKPAQQKSHEEIKGNCLKGEKPVKTFECSYCGQNFNEKQELLCHIKHHIRRTRTITDLTNHDKLSDGEKGTFQCIHCEKQFTSFKLICKHYKTKHSNLTGPTKTFACELCGLSLADSKKLKNHISLHFDDKPYKCNVCNKRFRLPRLLKLHCRIHIPKSQRTDLYHCDKCDKRNFSSAVTLWKHKRIHNGKITEKFCKVCNKRFINSNLLEKHMLKHKNEAPRPYKCDLCGKSFKILKEFNRHKKRQHGILTEEMLKLIEIKKKQDLLKKKFQIKS
ncbi:zinc finger protein 225-like [Lutzomyia longipalpis]|uniref:zinc finger protein 225-like n=1 Tax=Lutzomyia longipalpis TaxID=7200 RepID=UPI002483EF74|nr:zinc finger protein 225-like [Lutzomyia longipalpis]